MQAVHAIIYMKSFRVNLWYPDAESSGKNRSSAKSQETSELVWTLNIAITIPSQNKQTNLYNSLAGSLQELLDQDLSLLISSNDRYIRQTWWNFMVCYI